MVGKKEKCLAAGVGYYAARPIQSTEHFALIMDISPAQGQEVKEDAGVEAESRVIDKSDLLARTEGDQDLLKTLVDSFLEISPETLQKIRKAIAVGDAACVERAAHFLKGSLGTLSSVNALRAAEDLEQIAHKGDLASASEVYRTLEQDVAVFSAALRRAVKETGAKDR